MTGPWTNPRTRPGSLRHSTPSTRSRAITKTPTLTKLSAWRAFCEETGLTPGEAYVDRDGSREEFDRMMADGTAENPPFRRIVVCDLSRFARYAEELTECMKRLEANGIQVIAVDQWSSSQTQFGETIRKMVDDYHQEQVSDSVKRGLRHRASRGHFVSSKAPYGYRKVEAHDGVRRHYTLEPDPETAPTVRRIYDLALNGSSDTNTARDLNHDGIPLLKGRQWSAQAVMRIRRAEVNCGTYLFGRNALDGPVRVPDAFPAIVSREEFNMAQQMAELRQVTAQRLGGRPKKARLPDGPPLRRVTARNHISPTRLTHT